MKKIAIKVLLICAFASVLLTGCGKKADEDVIKDVQYQIVFKNDDGTELLSLKAGADSEISIADPTKEASDEYTYTFTGWDSEITKATEDKVYTAQYEKTKREYTVTFKNGDEVLSTTKYSYGQIPLAPEDPTKDAVIDYVYDFADWKQSINTGTAKYEIYGLSPVTQNTVYEAVYDEVATTTNSNNFCNLTYNSSLDGYVVTNYSPNPYFVVDFVIGDIYDDGTNGVNPLLLYLTYSEE